MMGYPILRLLLSTTRRCSQAACCSHRTPNHHNYGNGAASSIEQCSILITKQIDLITTFRRVKKRTAIFLGVALYHLSAINSHHLLNPFEGCFYPITHWLRPEIGGELRATAGTVSLLATGNFDVLTSLIMNLVGNVPPGNIAIQNLPIVFDDSPKKR